MARERTLRIHEHNMTYLASFNWLASK